MKSAYNYSKPNNFGMNLDRVSGDHIGAGIDSRAHDHPANDWGILKPLSREDLALERTIHWYTGFWFVCTVVWWHNVLPVVSAISIETLVAHHREDHRK
jgi:hypothetical protein